MPPCRRSWSHSSLLSGMSMMEPTGMRHTQHAWGFLVGLPRAINRLALVPGFASPTGMRHTRGASASERQSCTDTQPTHSLAPTHTTDTQSCTDTHNRHTVLLRHTARHTVLHRRTARRTVRQINPTRAHTQLKHTRSTRCPTRCPTRSTRCPTRCPTNKTRAHTHTPK